jgi:hypothetical protein
MRARGRKRQKRSIIEGSKNIANLENGSAKPPE